MMSWQTGDTVQLLNEIPGVVMAGRLVVRPLWGQCGLEGSFTNHSSAAISQSEMIFPLGRIQSSAVLLVQVPVCGEATYQANVKPWHLSSTGSVCPTGWPNTPRPNQHLLPSHRDQTQDNVTVTVHRGREPTAGRQGFTPSLALQGKNRGWRDSPHWPFVLLPNRW